MLWLLIFNLILSAAVLFIVVKIGLGLQGVQDKITSSPIGGFLAKFG